MTHIAPHPEAPPRRATLDDVARVAGVTPRTARKALSDQSWKVSPATREAVERAANLVGWRRPNPDRPTLDDVARAAKVSTHTARQVLAPRPAPPPDVAARVAATARRLGWAPLSARPAAAPPPVDDGDPLIPLAEWARARIAAGSLPPRTVEVLAQIIDTVDTIRTGAGDRG